ncbi:tail fiber domain-containing protein [Janthinobacterium sp. SUN118]|uniref:tail fiber domain-containing protein n=1 Tax=Janthinobacterium sp. SUN118 TaxID=3004100 RepID=UPI0025B280C4|nr:tail fiber domain-containing protein [Janthinobacterium sp. SUN118]MDN2709589.1 tail fiber domain-containing protein [Janthinobacterium sp. SUN118]
MNDAFYHGQKDLIRQLNQLALAKDIIDIPQNAAAAAASAAAAAASAVAAELSDETAETSASAAAASFKSLDARYLGAKALPPTVDSNGGALLTGAIYWDTLMNGGCLRVFQAGAWVTIPTNVASQISSTPVGGIAAANVQAALAELDSKKAVRATTLAAYGITDALPATYVPVWSSIAGRPAFAAVATSGKKADVGLGSVDNTPDAEKPVSAAQKAELDLKAPKSNPLFTGSVQATVGYLIGTGGHGLYSPVAGTLSMITNAVERFRVTDAGAMTFSNLVYAEISSPKLTVTSGGTTEIISKGQNGYGVFSAKASGLNPSIWDSYNDYGLCGRMLSNNSAVDSTFLFQLRKGGVLSDIVAMNPQQLYPTSDNVLSLGASATRYTTVYAATGAINTSDARMKTAIRAMTDGEISAAEAVAASIGTYKWLESIQAKGADARRHIGATVQGIIAIMEQHGLDPFEYGFICFDQWEEELGYRAAVPAQPAHVDAAGNVVVPAAEAVEASQVVIREAGSLYSLRNDQLNLFIARGLVARIARTEARHEALELRLAALEAV